MADQDPRHNIDVLRGRLEDGDRDVDDPADVEVLLKFSDQLDLLSSEYSDYRHLKLLRHCVRMAEKVGGLADALDDRDAAEAIVRWINRTYDNEETNRDYRSAIRVFGKRVLRSNEPPESIAWVPTGTSNSYDPIPNESEMLDWDDDVLPMLNECRNARDAAAIALQFEAGLRGGELEELTIGDIFDGEHSMGVHVDGKTGQRAVHLIVSGPYLQQWLADHPAGNDASAPLWSHLSKPKAQSYNSYLKNFKLPAERAGVTKPVTPTNFRKSNTRWLVKQGMNQARIEDRQGRKRGSEHTARYMARFGEESSERQYAQMHGRDVEVDETDEFAPLTCPRCDRESPRHEEFCVWCHMALTPEAAEEAEALEDRFFDAAAEAETDDELEDVREVRQVVTKSPAVRRVMLEK